MPTDDTTIPCASRARRQPDPDHPGRSRPPTPSRRSPWRPRSATNASASTRWSTTIRAISRPSGASPATTARSRPVAASLRTAIQSFSGFLDARFTPLVRAQARWAAWPDRSDLVHPQLAGVRSRLRPARQPTGDGAVERRRQRAARARPAHSARRRSLVDAAEPGPARDCHRPGLGDRPARRRRAHFGGDPPGYYFIGGEPRLLIEDGVPPGTPVTAAARRLSQLTCYRVT